MNDILYKLKKTDADVNALLIKHKNLVYSRLSKLGCLHVPEYESAAFEGLWNAVQTFDIFSQYAFSTYAVRCIDNAINNERRKTCILQGHEYIQDFTEANMANAFCDCNYEVESNEAVKHIRDVAMQYISSLKPNSKSAAYMRIWFAYGFTIRASEIAKMCNAQVSNVCRAQDMFRAYLRKNL